MSAVKIKPLSWTPRRRCDIYCSPACGHGCTYAEYLAAVNLGDKLAGQCGPGYTRHVSENLGWHYGAQSPCKRLHVSQYSREYFTAYLGGYAASGETPKQAIAKVIDAASADMARIAALIAGLETKG